MFYIISAVAQILIAAALVYATWRLANATRHLSNYTQSLATLTGELVKIENARENRTEREKGLADIRKIHAAATCVVSAKPEELTELLVTDRLGAELFNAIQTLAFLRRYIKDSETRQDVETLGRVALDIRAMKQTGSAGNFIKLVTDVHKRLYGSEMYAWLEEVAEIESKRK